MISKNIRHKWKLWLNTMRISYRYDVLIENAVTFKFVDSMKFGIKCTVQSGAYVYGSKKGNKINIGNSVVIGMNSVLLGEGGIEIGDGTHFGPNVVLTTQYGMRADELNSEITSLNYQPVRLGKKSWIGAGSIIMPGTILGDNCTIAPNSVVFGQWEDGITLSGNPARKRKF
jgi:acetyltransferase-like isoleucine patch superfamily enzyme